MNLFRELYVSDIICKSVKVQKVPHVIFLCRLPFDYCLYFHSVNMKVHYEFQFVIRLINGDGERK